MKIPKVIKKQMIAVYHVKVKPLVGTYVLLNII